MTAETATWPTDEEWVQCPTPEEVEAERQYLALLERIAEYEAYLELQAEEAVLEDFETWPLEDLVEELETVRTLTPDDAETIAEIEAAIAGQMEGVA